MLNRANGAIVEAMVDHLLAAYNEFARQQEQTGRPVVPSDAFMSVHNFHMLVVIELEKQLKLSDDPQKQLLFRQMAVRTLALGLEKRP